VSYTSRLPAVIAGLHARTELTAAEAADRIVERAKARAPIRTGALRDAIHKENAPDGFLVLAGDGGVFYGHIVEHGGVHTAPRPFLIPALEQTRAEVDSIGRRRFEGL
jgi:HK97 gp10 family phage protein